MELRKIWASRVAVRHDTGMIAEFEGSNWFNLVLLIRIININTKESCSSIDSICGPV